jgi:hypothetical protein
MSVTITADLTVSDRPRISEVRAPCSFRVGSNSGRSHVDRARIVLPYRTRTSLLDGSREDAGPLPVRVGHSGDVGRGDKGAYDRSLPLEEMESSL